MLSANKFGPVSAVSLAALVTGAILLQLAGSALNVLVPLEMALHGQPPALIGLVSSAYAGGFLLGCFTAGLLARRVGYIRAFAIFAACQSSLALSLALFTSAEVWLLLRFAGGFAGAGLAIVIESWINGRTPRAFRGRVLAAYNIVNRLAMVTGQLWPAMTAVTSTTAFIVMGVLFSSALVPVSLTRTRSPKRPEIVRLRFADLWRESPVSVFGCLYVGLIGGALVGILPVYGVLSEFSASAISVLTATVQIGALALQWPLGFASDRVDRRRIMLAASAVCLVISIGLLAVPLNGEWPVYAAFAIIGGTSLPVYALAVAHAYDKVGRERAVMLSSSLLFMWAAGSAVGPLLVSLAMQVAGPQGLHAYLVLMSATFIALTLWRMSRQSAPETRAPFAAVSQNSPVIGRTDQDAAH